MGEGFHLYHTMYILMGNVYTNRREYLDMSKRKFVRFVHTEMTHYVRDTPYFRSDREGKGFSLVEDMCNI